MLKTDETIWGQNKIEVRKRFESSVHGSSVDKNHGIKMNKDRQLQLLIGATDDYKAGLMSLNDLRSKIQGLLDILGDHAYKTSIEGPLLIIEELSADEAVNDPWLEIEGKTFLYPALDYLVAETVKKLDSLPAAEEDF